MSHLTRLYQHMAWADERTLASLRSMTKPPSQAVDLFAHVLSAEHLWLSRVEGTAPAHAIWPKLTLDRCATLAADNHQALLMLAAAATGPQGQRAVTYRNSSGTEYTSTLEDILLHIAQHGAYHRGQVALLVRANGGIPLLTDYIAYTRESM